jgi:hypothetical protein
VSSRVELALHAVSHCDPREADWVAGIKRAMPRA